MKISIVQLNSGDQIQKNLDRITELVTAAVSRDEPNLVVLPEYCTLLSMNPAKMREGGAAFASGEIARFFSELAKTLDVFIHAGSCLELHDDRLYNTAITFNPAGEQIAKYRKIHLFDSVLPNGQRMYESDIVTRGCELSTYPVGDVVVGTSICFDLRFPEMYQRLVNLGSQVLLVPSAFTFATGSAHWEVLLRARAIETQCYVVAPGQVFAFDDGKYACWGHSLVVDPWGAVVAQVSDQEGFTTTTIDTAFLESVRARIPMNANRWFDS